MVKYSWFKEEVPENIEIKQIYGVAFDKKGRVLLRKEDNIYKLTGGKPEKKDKNRNETLKREFKEELNAIIGNIFYLGYLLVQEDNIPPYAQVRMIAKIKDIGIMKPDVDNGKLYE